MFTIIVDVVDFGICGVFSAVMFVVVVSISGSLLITLY
jgi:hypothetical protein